MLDRPPEKSGQATHSYYSFRQLRCDHKASGGSGWQLLVWRRAVYNVLRLCRTSQTQLSPSLSDKLPATRQTVEHFVHQSARDDQMRSALPYVLLLCLWGCLQLPLAVSQAVTAGEHLDKTPLFPNGLSESTDLTKLLPNQEYSFAASSDSGSNCFASGGTDECAKAGSTWSVNKVTYNDNPDTPIYVCACDNSPYSAESLASDYSYVSHQHM